MRVSLLAAVFPVIAWSLLDNRKPQIAFFSVQSGRVAPPPVVGVAPLPAGEVSNRAERAGRQGNTVVVFLDQRNTPPPEQAVAIQRIAKFIGTRGPQDRTGIYTSVRDGSLKVIQEITSDSELLSRAAASLKAPDPGYLSQRDENSPPRWPAYAWDSA
jgi:hypothetical protein